MVLVFGVPKMVGSVCKCACSACLSLISKGRMSTITQRRYCPARMLVCGANKETLQSDKGRYTLPRTQQMETMIILRKGIERRRWVRKGALQATLSTVESRRMPRPVHERKRKAPQAVAANSHHIGRSYLRRPSLAKEQESCVPTHKESSSAQAIGSLKISKVLIAKEVTAVATTTFSRISQRMSTWHFCFILLLLL